MNERATMNERAAMTRRVSMDEPETAPRASGTADVREAVRARYAAAAQGGSCCESSPTATLAEPSVRELDLGCGNPLPFAGIQPGDTVLDLGSGSGAEVLRAARMVGPAGWAIGVDMTDEMLELARANQRAAGLANVEFLKGEIESLPLPDSSVDVIVSNCVLNLSPDKASALKEAFRVLRPGGRFGVADIVIEGSKAPDAARRSDLAGWSSCANGAMTEAESARALTEAGFVEVRLERIATYGERSGPAGDAAGTGVAQDSRDCGCGSASEIPLASDLILARKPPA